MHSVKCLCVGLWQFQQRGEARTTGNGGGVGCTSYLHYGLRCRAGPAAEAVIWTAVGLAFGTRLSDLFSVTGLAPGTIAWMRLGVATTGSVSFLKATQKQESNDQEEKLNELGG